VFHNFVRFWFFVLGKQWANSIQRAHSQTRFQKSLAPPVPAPIYAQNGVIHARAAISRGNFTRFA
jgi:hypothetical protein